MRIVVDLPAPLGPRNPWTSPGATSRSSPSRARTGPKVLVSPWVRMTDWDALMGGYSFRGRTERALGIDEAGFSGPPVHPLGGQRVGTDRRGDLISQEDEREVVDQEERRSNVGVLARPSHAHLDHRIEEAPGRGVPPSEQRGSRRVVRQEQPAQVGRQRRAGRKAPGECLGERSPRLATDEQLDELVGRHGLEDRVKRPRGERVDFGAEAVLAPEVVEDERRRRRQPGWRSRGRSPRPRHVRRRAATRHSGWSRERSGRRSSVGELTFRILNA